MAEIRDLYPPMKPFGKIAQSEFERARAEQEKMNSKPSDFPTCPRCFGIGWEEYRENGYRQVRKCDHVVPETDDEDVSMF